MKWVYYSFLAFFSLLFSSGVYSQQLNEMRDTLRSITIIADTSFVRATGVMRVDMPRVQHMVTALGEGDVIKYIQTMPGIAAGVDGTSSFYVRGGNIGNNVVTIDGVRLYGYGHLLGITSAFSNDIVGSANFNVGGFSAESHNMLASHIEINTKEPDFKGYNAKFGVSNFMVSGYATSPVVEDKLAVVLAARISPLALEYKIGKNWLDSRIDIFDNLHAGVYDLFGKLSFKANKKHTLNASFFYTSDDFGYGDMHASSYDNMNWSNMIGNLEWKCILSDKWNIKSNVSFNKYGSGQIQERVLQEVYNKLSVNSSIEELMFNTSFDYSWSDGWNLKFGIRGTKSVFNPGSFKEYGESSDGFLGNRTDNWMGNGYVGLTYQNKDKARFSLAVRGNYFIGEKGKYDEYKGWHPESSFSASAKITKWMGIAATYDQLVQYYHTLEGIPLGWSVDMIVPSSMTLAPEMGVQYYGGLFFKVAKNHRLTVGVYYKEYENLIFFEKASDFFGQSLTGWKEFVKVGDGESKGVEFLYEKTGNDLNFKVAYTFSETMRFFPQLNEGVPFRAKFDRPHILNATVDYRFMCNKDVECGANFMLSYQSGNMETVQSGTYPGILPGYDVDFNYYSGFNNFRLEDYIRADIGWYGIWKRDRCTHNLKLGVYNITNRHNIFSLYYDSDESTWKKVYVFPIMPSINYRVEF